MVERRKRNVGFLCFPVSDHEDEAGARGGGIVPQQRRPSRQCLIRRAFTKIFRTPPFVASLNQREKEGKESNRPLSRDGLHSSDGKLTDCDDRRAASIFSGSSLSSSSSSSSSLSLVALEAFPEPAVPKAPQKRAPTRRAAEPRKAPSWLVIFLLVASLSVMVFCGRLCTILWTSSWLFLGACRYSDVGTAAAAKGVEECTLLAELRRLRLAEAVEKKRVVWKASWKETEGLTFSDKKTKKKGHV